MANSELGRFGDVYLSDHNGAIEVVAYCGSGDYGVLSYAQALEMCACILSFMGKHLGDER